MIKACIFDLGGTIIDKYSLTPLLSLKQTFSRRDITLNQTRLLNDNWMDKQAHMLKLLNDTNVLNQWLKRYMDYPDEYDVKILFNDFYQNQHEYLKNDIEIIPETRECISYLRFNYIKTGSMSEHNQTNTELIQHQFEREKIYLDSYVSSCQKNHKRKEIQMIHQNITNMGIRYPQEVMKIDDNVSGIKEGNNAGCITVGVAKWSVHMNILNSYKIDETERQEKLKRTRGLLKDAGADHVIDSLDELPRLIEKINYK